MNFTDNCPSCCHGPNQPIATRETGPNRTDRYRCGNCGQTWLTHRVTTCYPARPVADTAA